MLCLFWRISLHRRHFFPLHYRWNPSALAGRPRSPPSPTPTAKWGWLMIPCKHPTGAPKALLPVPFPKQTKQHKNRSEQQGTLSLLSYRQDERSLLIRCRPPVRITEAALRGRPLANPISRQPQMRHREGKKYLVNLKCKKQDFFQRKCYRKSSNPTFT